MSTLPPFPLVFLLLLQLLLPCLALSSLDPIPGCPLAYCGGEIVDIYPFWLPPNTTTDPNSSTFCGYPDLHLLCLDGRLTKNTSIGSYTFLTIDHTTRTASMVDADLLASSCPVPSRNLTYQETTPLYYAPGVVNYTFYFNCSSDLPGSIPWLQHNVLGKSYLHLPGDPYPRPLYDNCQSIVEVPSLDAAGTGLEEVVKTGFKMAWDDAQGVCGDCEISGGRCAMRQVSGFLCLCADGEHALECKYKKSMTTMKIGIGVGGIAITLALILMILCILKAWTWRWGGSDQEVESFLSSNGPLAVKRYRSYQVKKMTTSYSTKLGQGGCGTVYKGALPDGTLVAVKRLKDTNGTGEEFINEVASIGRTNHVNVVSLLGFCYERASRALIYEFMPNGSLEKYLFVDNPHPPTIASPLGWEKLHEVAVGIAKGLEYLHKGCNTRMVHFDIKPHNILLDKDFCPKISDFGLAKLHKDKESRLSSMLPRGTVGYIAPEVFCRNFGVVSGKSDVYSYGMMVLDMVGGRRRKANGCVQETSELYFPHWIYEHLDDEDCGLRECGVAVGSEEIARKMVLVGLWCIQTNPSSRPLISKVVEMLEGSVDNLEIPPKPYLCSPERSNHTSQRDSLPTISGSL